VTLLVHVAYVGQVDLAASARQLPLVRTGVAATSTVAFVPLIVHSANGIRRLAASSIGSLGSPPLARVRYRVLRRHLFVTLAALTLHRTNWIRWPAAG